MGKLLTHTLTLTHTHTCTPAHTHMRTKTQMQKHLPCYSWFRRSGLLEIKLSFLFAAFPVECLPYPGLESVPGV